MMTIIAAAALAAQPAAPAPAAPGAQHQIPMQMGEHADHMDCCKDCCKDMEAKMEGHHAEGGR
jgi:hypothetical protein